MRDGRRSWPRSIRDRNDFTVFQGTPNHPSSTARLSGTCCCANPHGILEPYGIARVPLANSAPISR